LDYILGPRLLKNIFLMASVKHFFISAIVPKAAGAFINVFSESRWYTSTVYLWVSEGRWAVYEEICNKLDLSSFWKPVHMVIEAFGKLA
jgi:hypothetical protein